MALEKQLAEKDGVIKKMKQQEMVHRKELKLLMRGNKREGVNMEYLKNVVMQYMMKRDTHSTEQKGLAPVIFTMLQFTPKEKAEVLAADTTWFGECKTALLYCCTIVLLHCCTTIPTLHGSGSIECG
jgi:hypothetical protein